MRVVAAFLLAPILPAVVAELVGWASGDICDAGMHLFAAILFGYPVVAVLGIPGYLYFRRRGWLKLWQIVSGGAAAGVLVPVVLAIPDLVRVALTQGETSELWSVFGNRPYEFIFIPLGAVTALSFWCVALAPIKRWSISNQVKHAA